MRDCSEQAQAKRLHSNEPASTYCNVAGGGKVPEKRKVRAPTRPESRLCADRRANGGGNRLAVAFHVAGVLRLHHHPRQWLRAGVAQYDATRFS